MLPGNESRAERTDVGGKFHTRTLPNGLTLLGQQMDHVSSAAMTILVPGGASHDPTGSEGAAAVVAEWCLRGAGQRDTRQLNDALDGLGCQRHETVLSEHIQLSTAQLGRNLADILAIYGDIIRRPQLGDGAFGPCRDLVAQDLASLEDEPARKCNLLLRERFYPPPLGRCIYGRAESLAALCPEAVRGHVRECFTPRGAILALAGRIDWNEACDLAESHFGDWPPGEPPEVVTHPPEAGVTHIRKDSAQVHIAMAHKAAPASDDRYYAARMAETVLSGGMSGRLFTEVREKRGLVYHVSSRYHSLKAHAGMFTYAGTTPAKAQETFDVTVRELRRLGEGVEPDELARARTQLKSALVMQGESTTARANALAGDWYHLGRLRSLDEISDAIDAVTREEVLAYLHEFPAEQFTLLVVGPDPLDTGAIAGREG